MYPSLLNFYPQYGIYFKVQEFILQGVRLNESIKQVWYSRLIRELLWLCGFSLSLFCSLAIVSFDANDPGWSYQGTTGTVTNIIGPLGAFVADWLLSWFGLAAFGIALIPLLMIFWILKPTADGRFLLTRIFGLAFLIPGLCIALGLHIGQGMALLPQGTPGGGILGSLLVEPLVLHVGSTGSALVGLINMVFGTTISFRLHWFRVLEILGAIILKFCYAFSLKPKQSELIPIKKPSFLSRIVFPSNRSFLPKTLRGLLVRIAPAPPETDVVQIEAEILGLRTSKPSVSKKVTETKSTVSNKADEFKAKSSQFNDESGERIEPTIDYYESFPEMKSKCTSDITIGPLVESETLIDSAISDSKSTLANTNISLNIGKNSNMTLPDLSLLDSPSSPSDMGFSQNELKKMGQLLIQRLAEFGIKADILAINPGPVVTRFEIDPAPGVKVSRITNLAKDLARSLAVISVRVVEVIPGKSTVGIEIPNQHREMVKLWQILSADTYTKDSSMLTLALGQDISGQSVCVNLERMPHLLVAGTTGSGKSVGVNAMILSMLYKARPEDLRLILVDPKMLELSVYEGIPHLLAPVVTDMRDAANALRWCVSEMERRYKLMAALGVRNLDGFNTKVRRHRSIGKPLSDPFFEVQESESQEQPPILEALPLIVVVIDEFADMMMIVGKKVDQLIARLAQKARAAGIHLILATQRPSVDVITGLIKANIPSRISFQVSSKVDSRTILDQGGAEQLLGNGDMLYLPSGKPIPIRIHGAFVSDHEVHKVVEFWKEQGQPDFENAILEGQDSGSNNQFSSMGEDDEVDPLYDEAVIFVVEARRASISAVQRKLKIGYNRAARIIEAMETAGVVSEMGSNGTREVLVPSSQ